MFEFFLLERHFDQLTAIAADMGAGEVNVVPDLPGANSAFQIVFHCCGMLEWWTRSAILGLPVDRDRDAEFVAAGSLDELLSRAAAVRAQFVTDLAAMDPSAPLRGDPSEEYVGTPLGDSTLGVLLHVLEELAQHHGHLEITRDLVAAGPRGQ